MNVNSIVPSRIAVDQLASKIKSLDLLDVSHWKFTNVYVDQLIVYHYWANKPG
jgi:hypothetical protein